MKKNNNLDGQGFHTHPERINKKGRPPSIKKQISKILASEGNVLIPSEQVEAINEDGSVSVLLPNKDKIAMRLFTLAMSKKGNESIAAIRMIMEYIDGRPTQSIHADIHQRVEQPLFPDVYKDY